MDTALRHRTEYRGYPALALGAIGVAVLVTVGLLYGDRTPALDRWGLRTLTVEPGSLAETLVAAVSDGLRAVSVAGAAAAIGWLLWRGRRRAVAPALGYLLLFLTLAPSSELLKDVFGRAHPTDPADVSYPSTHVVMVTVAVIIIAAILRPAGRRAQLGMGMLAACAIVATAATRVTLAEHHLTDVLGTAVGYAGVALCGALLLHRSTRADAPAPRRPGSSPAATGRTRYAPPTTADPAHPAHRPAR